MPPRNRNRRRGVGRRPNVFVQTERPSDRSDTSASSQSDADATPAVAQQTYVAPPQQRASGRRTQRTRSEVYARTFPLEIRKMGIISVGVVVALVVFTIVL